MSPETSLFNDLEINEIVELNGCQILKETTNNLENHLKDENKDTDTTDGIFDTITALSDEIRGEFEDLLEGDDGKKRFLKLLSKISTLLLNTKVGTADKIKKKIRIAIETTIKI